MDNIKEKLRRFLSLAGWKQFFQILNPKEKKLFFTFFLFTLLSAIFLVFAFYFENTKIIPTEGGIHIEGVIGSPRFINPIYSAISDIDRDLTKLVFGNGLMRWYDKDNRLVTNLAKSYSVLEDGRVFEFYLREGLLWSDNTPITADDVVFTIRTIQNPEIKSPIQAQWLGVEVERVADLKVRFRLKNPSPIFLENATLALIPKHIWSNISVEKFPLSNYNLNPVGSGPYKVKSISQNVEGRITGIDLVINQNYFGKRPYIPKIRFQFFENQEGLSQAINRRNITGLFIPALENNQEFKNNLRDKGFLEYRYLMPRYFALFFNQERSKILERDEIRAALNYGTNIEELITQIAPEQQAELVTSPILPEIFGFTLPEIKQQFNFDRAVELLAEQGFQEKENGVRFKVTRHYPAFQFRANLARGSRGREVEELQRCLANFPEIYPEGVISGHFGSNTELAVIRFQEKHQEEGTGRVNERTRARLNEVCHQPRIETLPLRLSLSTLNQPLLIKTAEQIKAQWAKLGVELEIKTFDFAHLEREIIRPRNYEILLFGQSLRAIPDPFSFWHSDQVRDPGLNLTSFQDKEADELLEKNRKTLDEGERRLLLEKFQNILLKDQPAIFLFNPTLLYFVSERIRGVSDDIIIDPSKRFNNIENWYIKTKRVWK